MRKILSVMVIIAMIFWQSGVAFAVPVNGTWALTGSSASGNWTTAADWSTNPNVPGVAGDSASLTSAITATTTVTLNSPETVGTLNIGTNGQSWVLTGDTLTLNNSGSGALINDGAATSGTNTISAPISLADSSGNYTITNGSGSTLTINGGISSGIAGTQTITNSGSGAGAVALSSITNGSGTVALVENGTSALTLSGTNTYSGGTTLTSGTLNFNSTTAIGSGSLTINGGTINNTSGGAITDANTNAITLGSSFAFGTSAGTASNDLNLGTGAVSNSASNNITLNGEDTLTFGGVMTNTAGAANLLTVTNGAGTNSTTAVNFGGYALTNNASNYTDIINGTGNVNITGAVVNGGTATASALSYTGSGTLDLSGNNTYDGLTTLNNSSGTLILSGNNSGTGGVTLTAGTLDINSTTALGATAGTLTINGGTINNTDGSAITNANNNAVTLGGSFGFGTSAGTASNDLNLGTGAVSNSASSTITLNGEDTLTFGGTMTNTAGAINTLTVNNGAGTNATTAVSFGGYALSNSSTNYVDVINGSGNVNITGAVTNGASSASGLTYSGTGTLTLTGTNTYTGGTTLSSGTLVDNSTQGLGTVASALTLSGGTLDIQTNSTAYNTTVSGTPVTIDSDLATSGAGTTQTLGTLSIGADTLDVSKGGNVSSGTAGLTFGATTLTATGADFTANTGTLLTLGSVSGSGYNFTVAGAGNTDITGIIGTGTGTLTKSGTGTLTLTGANTYSGTTTISAGTLQVGSGGSTGSLGTGGVTDNGTLTFDLTSSPTVSNNISGTGALVQESTGTLTLSGNNSYSGATTIASGSTLVADSTSALGTGAGHVTNNGTLTIGTTALDLSGSGSEYIQSATGSLNVTANSSSSYGSITTQSTSTVNNSGTINVTVGGYIPNSATLEIINASGEGVTGGVPTVTSTNSFISFVSSVSGGNLYLTANHSSTGFAAAANNANSAAAGQVLDNETNPTSDMITLLDALQSSTPGQVAAALNTMTPIVDGGVIASSGASLNEFVGASFERAQSVLALASSTGVSAGDANPLNNLWAKQYGGYDDQGTRNGIQGYDAWNTGTAVGIDHLFMDNLTVGVSAGYAYGDVDSDIDNGNTNINSAQATIYGGYQGTSQPYYVDAAGTVAENWYNGRRDVQVVNINRVADSQYKGTQTGLYLEGGYKFDLGNIQLTPLTSLQWTYLSLNSYNETNAGAADLNVNSQSYNTLESGLGASISYPIKLTGVNLTPELHAKWLYDYIDQGMSVTSSFAGGGGSFTTNGTAPARNGADVGGKLTVDLNNDLSVIGAIDTDLRDDFFGITGSVSVQYKF